MTIGLMPAACCSGHDNAQTASGPPSADRSSSGGAGASPRATCLAYGVDLNLAQLVFVNTAASVLSSLIPTPGGIGVAEASLSAGLIAMGIDKPTAFAIAITQRLWTFYLPPIWGYVSLRWLTRKGFI